MTIVNPPTYAELCAADLKAKKAKEKMDAAHAALEKAEDEWHQACIESDRLAEGGVDGEVTP